MLHNMIQSLSLESRLGPWLRKTLALFLLTATVVQWSVAARALPRAGTFGVFLTGQERAASFRQTLFFRDLPTGEEGAAILRLAAQGILRGDGSGLFRPADPVTRQEALVALVRLLGLEQQAVGASSQQLGAGSAARAASWAQGYITLAAQKGLTGSADSLSSGSSAHDQALWTDPVSREEVAAWAVRSLATPPLSPAAAHAGLAATFPDAAELDPELRPLVEQALALGLISGRPGATAAAQAERLDPKGALSRGELAYLLDRLQQLLPAGPGRATWGLATLTARMEETEELAGRPVRATLWELTGPGGSAIALKLVTGSGGEAVRDVVVLREGALTLGENLQVGDNIRYLVTQGEVVPFIEVLSEPLRIITGEIEEIDLMARKVALRDLSGHRHESYVVDQSVLTMGGKVAALEYLACGQQVSVKTLAGVIWEMSAEVAVDPFSQRTSTKVVTGTLRYRNQGSIVVTLASGAVAEYEVTAATQVLAGGRLSKLSAVQSGDTVLLHLPEPESSWVERIEVAGRAGRVTELYRGRLGSFSTRGGAIVLTRPERLVGDSWQEVGTGVLQLPLATSAVLWWGQQQLDLSTAARLTGQVAYVAAGNGFGRPEAMRVLVARGQEKAYTGRIKDINPVLGELALPAGEIALSPGAIILKDGRLADVLALTADDSVQALVEKGAAGSLGLVVTVLGQASAVPAELTIYKGEIDLVGSNAWTLRHYYTLEDNEWDYRGRRSTAELGLSRDTVILDLVDGTPRVLTLAEFRQGYHQRRFRRATVLAVSGEGDETLAAALWFEDELGAERLSAGRVTVISEGSDQVTFNLEDARDYSTARGEWRSTSEPQVLRLDTALVIKAGRGANWEELAVGDEVQVLRCGQSALLVLVKE